MTSINSDDLEKLIAHEARYFEIWSKVTRTTPCWFLDSVNLPDYQSANRALRLRYPKEVEGSGREKKEAGDPEGIVAEIIAHYRERGLAVVADVDGRRVGALNGRRRAGAIDIDDIVEAGSG